MIFCTKYVTIITYVQNIPLKSSALFYAKGDNHVPLLSLLLSLSLSLFLCVCVCVYVMLYACVTYVYACRRSFIIDLEASSLTEPLLSVYLASWQTPANPPDFLSPSCAVPVTDVPSPCPAFM